jgi:hypothetical protein
MKSGMWLIDSFKGNHQLELALRIVVMNPPAGVAFALQEGQSALLLPSEIRKQHIAFAFSVRVGDKVTGEGPNFLGSFIQGPRGGRFVYVNSGKRAGQINTEWDRRAKVPLAGIGWTLIKAATARSGAVVEGRINGAGRDGGPSCGSVDLIDAWRVVA